MANWEFWEWGKTNYKVDAGISNENQLLYFLALLKDQIHLEVKQAYLDLAESQKQIIVAERSIE